jgi:hypothetical protein
MPSHHQDLGELRSVHRPTTVRLWLMGLVAVAVLSFFLVGVLAWLNSLPSGPAVNKEGLLNTIAGPAICLGVPVLLLALVSSFLLKDFRKWSASRTSKLMIFEKGFSYESAGRIETCRWDDIKDITFRRVEVTSKHSPPRKVNLIRSIVRKDGEMISLAETLNLGRITRLITTASKGKG